jgi:hypothetical protein
MQVKIFTETEIPKIEKAINDWLHVNKDIEVIQILQTEFSDEKFGFSITISIFYHERQTWSPEIGQGVKGDTREQDQT